MHPTIATAAAETVTVGGTPLPLRWLSTLPAGFKQLRKIVPSPAVFIARIIVLPLNKLFFCHFFRRISHLPSISSDDKLFASQMALIPLTRP